MPTTLPPELEQFVEDELSRGNYRSRDEVIAAGLRLLQERDRKLESLRQEIDRGLEQIEREETITLEGEEQRREFFDDIKRSGRERLARQRDDA